MKNAMTLELVDGTDSELIEQIARWYHSWWQIPKEKTLTRLRQHPNDDILLQLVVRMDSRPVATGGLYNQVSLHQAYPTFEVLRPWVALLYTEEQHRGKGVGTFLLNSLSTIANEKRIPKIYLYTYTAEELYNKNGWIPRERVHYKGHTTVVMEKMLQRHPSPSDNDLNCKAG